MPVRRHPETGPVALSAVEHVCAGTRRGVAATLGDAVVFSGSAAGYAGGALGRTLVAGVRGAVAGAMGRPFRG